MKNNQLPISAKAYARFITRIETTLADSPTCITAMRNALDRYLAGETSVADTLPTHLRTAFLFLRHEIDTAIERSRRARERARMRREMIASSVPGPTPSSPITTDINNDSADDSPTDENVTGFRLSRSQRREQQRNIHRTSNKKRNKRLCPLPSKSTSK